MLRNWILPIYLVSGVPLLLRIDIEYRCLPRDAQKAIALLHENFLINRFISFFFGSLLMASRLCGKEAARHTHTQTHSQRTKSLQFEQCSNCGMQCRCKMNTAVFR